MARIFTSPEKEQEAKSIMHDITLLGGLRTVDQRIGPRYSYESKAITAMQAVCDELQNRDFNNIDNSLNILYHYTYFPKSLDGQNNWRGWVRTKPEHLAKAIVYFAELVNIYWDDTLKTPYEIDEFKNSILGAAVYKYGRYISAIKDKTSRSKSNATSTSGGTTTSGATKSAPQNGYKQSGPQSGNVRDLQGNPGDKVTADTSFIYKIIGDNPQSKNVPNVFIKPLNASGETAGTNKIFISSGNGYTDCTCYFDDPNDAQTFLDKIIQNNRVPSNITNLRVVKLKADPNGYFLVGTEFGTVAVSAKTLNEALAEEVKEVKEELSGWEKATKDYSKKELDELHAWMRRD